MITDCLDFDVLKGKTITKIEGLEEGSYEVVFTDSEGQQYKMHHYTECCESVSVEDIIGDIDDILDSPLLMAEEVTSNENPDGVVKEYQDSFTWTFYKLATQKGYLTIRWYGESNGYYSEYVNFEKL